MMTKREWAAQQAAKRKAERQAKKEEQKNWIPNPEYKKKLTHSEIFAGVKKKPRFIPPSI